MMKKNLSLLAISFVCTAIIDLTFAFWNLPLTILIGSSMYFLAGFLFYDRVKIKLLGNSFFIFLFLIALISFLFIVNPKSYLFGSSVIITSILGYVFGFFLKRRIQLRRL